MTVLAICVSIATFVIGFFANLVAQRLTDPLRREMKEFARADRILREKLSAEDLVHSRADFLEKQLNRFDR